MYRKRSIPPLPGARASAVAAPSVSHRKRGRIAALTAGALAVATFALGNSAHAAASDIFRYLAPGGAVCSGGDTGGPTVLQARRSVDPAYAVGSAQSTLLSHIYLGTTCQNEIKALFPTNASNSPATSANTPVVQTNATSPQYSCPRTSAYWNQYDSAWECIGADVVLGVTYNTLTDEYNAGGALDFNTSAPGIAAGWTSQQASIYDYAQSSWYSFGWEGFSDYYNKDSQGFYSTQTGTVSNATYQVLCPGSGLPPTPLGVAVCSILQNGQQYVHVGIQATLSATYQATAPYCYSATFYPNAGEEYFERPPGGFCTSP